MQNNRQSTRGFSNERSSHSIAVGMLIGGVLSLASGIAFGAEAANGTQSSEQALPYMLAALEVKSGQKTPSGDVIMRLGDSINLDANAQDPDVVAIQEYLNTNQLDKAVAAVEALEKRQPKSPTTFILKGAVYYAKGDRVIARKSYEQAVALAPKSVAAIMNLTQLDLLENKADAARERFNTMLAADKTSLPAMLGLAGIAGATGKDAEYVSWLEKAAAANPTAARPRVLLVNYYLKKADVRKATSIALEAQAALPNDPQVLEAVASVQSAAGENENAVVTYRKITTLDPNNEVAHYKLATAYATNNNLGAAKTSLDRALALRPDYLEAEILLATTEKAAGHPAEAMKIAQGIQKRHPSFAAGYILQGDVQMSQKQYAPAAKAYEKALELNKITPIFVKMHQALSASGNASEAEARLRQWVKDQPQDSLARIYLATTYVMANKNKLAIEQYQLVLENDPTNAGAMNDLAYLYQQEKDPRALATAEKAYSLQPQVPEIMDTLGWILVEQGNTDRGVDLLKTASEKAPSIATIRYHYVVALAKSGNKPKARQELQSLLSRSKTFPQRAEAEALLKQL